MKSRRLVIAAAYALIAVAAARTQRAPSAEAGRQIYTSGSETITASMGGSTELSSTMLPCANCHGADGRGGAEGGVVASNIRWLELTKPYRAATPNGRRRPAYDEQTLRRAIVDGVDSAGNALHAAMPRYAMSAEELNDLAAYLKVLGAEEAPGVSDGEVRVGTIVPERGAEMANVLQAYFDETGAIHGRRINVEVMNGLDLANPPFALVGGVTNARVEEAVERAGIPLVLPVSLWGDADGNRQRFYLSAGIEEQIRALLEVTKPQTLKIVTRDEALLNVAKRVAAELDVVITDGGDAAVLVLDPSARIEGKGLLLFAGNLLPPDFFQYGDRVRVALTATPGDLTSAGVAEYRAFAARNSISGTHFATYAAAQAFVHALKESGRELTRESLRQALEGLYEFETGVTPALTFGRGRRIGSPRIHIAAMDGRGMLVPIGADNVQKTD